MEQTMVRGPRSGWREDEIDQLWREIQRANASGQPLRSVFEEMGGRLGRKPNSVRNYYYMQLRGQEGDTLRRAQPFETFTEAEVRSLLKSVLRARAQGQSVRACVMALSQGDHARMLRYQNKYRSVIKNRPEYVEKLVAEDPDIKGIWCVPHPAEKAPGAGGGNLPGAGSRGRCLRKPHQACGRGRGGAAQSDCRQGGRAGRSRCAAHADGH